MTSQLLIGLVGVIGVLLGAMAQAFGGHALAVRQFKRSSRHDAYALFLSSVARVSVSMPGSQERLAAMADLTEVRCRIALYGSKAVVRKLSQFSRQHKIVNYEALADVAEVIDEMRADSGASRIEGLGAELQGILFSTPGQGLNQ